MYHTKRVALVLPAYNEEVLIVPTIERAPEIIDKIFVVNDGSTDKTADLVIKKSITDKRVELVNQPRNLGLGQAIITGYLTAAKQGYDYIVVAGGGKEPAPPMTDKPFGPLGVRGAG